MDERPSFRNRKDVWRLVIALALPWVLLVIAYSGVLLLREVYRADRTVGWAPNVGVVWFFAFGFPGLLSLVTFILIGIYWLVRHREYRKSWYGWLWLVLMWANAGVLSTVAH